MTEPPQGPEVPERFVDDQHRYRLDSRLATGGMGEVWRATDTSLGRPVAVKVLKSEYADDPQFRSRFETEARHAASLVHPGVASVYDFGEAAPSDGSGVPRPFLVMELVDGQPLSALLRGGRPLDPEVVRDLMAQTADALGAAHRAGIVHRDVKPANLLVTPDRRIKITDFGIARASDGLGLTGTGQVMGTPQYLSPEQARGGTATPASDVYSLGVVAFECLVGHRPFEADSPVATALAHLNDPVPDLPPSVPADLAAVVRRAMAKEPEQRYADGDAFAAALRNPAAEAATAYVPPVVVPPPASTQSTQVMPPVPPLDPTPTPAADQQHTAADRRRTWLVVLLVAAVVAAIVLAAVLVATAGGGNDEPTATDTTSSAPTTSPPTTETTPTQETSSAPAEVHINESDYLGRPVDVVAAELRSKGLQVDTQPVDNPGGKEADTVANVSPTTGLVEGDTVTVDYYREAAPTSEPPTTEPTTPSDTPTTEPTSPATSPAATSTGSPAAQTASASASPVGAPPSRSPSPSASGSGQPGGTG